MITFNEEDTNKGQPKALYGRVEFTQEMIKSAVDDAALESLIDSEIRFMRKCLIEAAKKHRKELGDA